MDGGPMWLWDVRTGNRLRVLDGHNDGVLRVAFSPDGNLALSGSNDRTVKLWDVQTAKEIRTFSGHESGVTAVAFSPDGATALSGSYDATVKLWDLGRGLEYLRLAPIVAKAQESLQLDPNDPQGLSVLGQWYAFRGLDDWAAELLERARDGGAAVPTLLMARCEWRAGRLPQAALEFQRALSTTRDDVERLYLTLCFQAVQIGAGKALAAQGKFKEAAAGFAHAIELNPADNWNWYYEGCLLAYLRDREAYAANCRAMLGRWGGTADPELAERTAKTCLLLPGAADPQQLLSLTEGAVAKASTPDLLTWFRMAKSLSLYRCGDYRGCAQLVELCKREQDRDNAPRTATCDLLLAMSNQRLGESASAEAVLDRAEQRIERDLPKPGRGDLSSGLENWLVCQTLRREAEALIRGNGQ
jgi:tetratricopeptide (TPR) repeat protein